MISFLSGAEVNIFAPSLPMLQSQFSLSLYETQFLVGVNFLAFCVGCLIIGVLGDKFQRKQVALNGIILFIVGTTICTIANKYHFLLLGRFIQGAGISAPAILGFVIISDNYPLEKQKFLLGIYNCFVTFSMSSASVLGNWINYSFGWRVNFLLLLIIGMLCLILCYRLIPDRPCIPNLKGSFNPYYELLKSRKLITFIACICLLVAPYWSFISLSPMLFLNDFGVDIRLFGFYQGSIALAFAMMSAFSMPIAKIIGARKLGAFCASLYVGGICLFFYALFNQARMPAVIVIGMILICAAAAYPLNSLYPLSLRVIAESKSRIAALINSIRLLFVFCVINSISFFYNGTFQPIGVAFIIMVLAFLSLFVLILKKGWLYEK